MADVEKMEKEPFVKELIDSGEYQSIMKPPITFGMRSGRVYLPVGTDCGEHTTGDCEELLVFLIGKGIAIIGDNNREFPIGAGKVTYIPPQTKHNIKNTSDEPLSYVFCVAPAISDSEK
ncbi:MAG: cupin domain-containing protein [Anaerohalosphaeraceae bacterium]|nr:cupin domain-containing protein [Anaerohalosphaeraceae bacterium]